MYQSFFGVSGICLKTKQTNKKTNKPKPLPQLFAWAAIYLFAFRRTLNLGTKFIFGLCILALQGIIHNRC